MHDMIVKQPEQPISSSLRIHPRFLRSIYLENDIFDPESSLGYILTPLAREALDRVLCGFQPNSTQRAWRVSGDYGSGKSAWGLALARIASGRASELPESLKTVIPEEKYFPVVATGNSEPLGITILRAFGLSTLSLATPPSHTEVIEAVRKARTKVKGSYSGVVLILDELGKNLEYAAQHPESDDVFLLQRLAEEAARSGTAPFIIVAMLHQGIAAYTVGMDSTGKREWNKVAGRFEEIIFSQPLEQITALVAATLDVDHSKIPEVAVSTAETEMAAAIGLGIYGADAAESMVGFGAKIFPLHPTVLPPLVRTIRRFGQNERSLFSFLSSAEPMGLQHHCSNTFSKVGFYRLDNLFDYVSCTLLPNITVGTSHTHWGIIEGLLASIVVESPQEEIVLKTIALLSILDSPDLPATEEFIILAIGGEETDETKKAIDSLQTRGVIYERGVVKGFCLWPHTSVNLDELFEKALQATSQHEEGVRLLCKHITSEHLVPRGYYFTTGTLRYAEVLFLPSADLLDLFIDQPRLNGKGADLNVRVVLPADKAQESNAQKFLHKCHSEMAPGLIIAVAEPPCSAIAALKDLVAWKWVQENEPMLSGDKYAREEVGRQIHQCEKVFRARLAGLDNLATPGSHRMAWYHQKAVVELSPGRELLTFMGTQCSDIYGQAPRIRNELINRRFPSASAVAARTKLVDAMASAAEKPFLGMEESKRPAEMALYLSVIKAGGFHIEAESGWIFRIPSPDEDKWNLLPCLDEITKVLQVSGPDALVPVPRIFESLSIPPFGIREGLQPFILSIYLAVNHQRCALYEDGTYLDAVTGEVLLRMMKEPQFFELQYCAIEGLRSQVFNKLLEMLKIDPRNSNETDLIDLIRPLVRLVGAEVPEYSRKTNNISEMAVSVRRCLLTAREPLKLVFTALPVACGLDPFDAGSLQSPEELASRLRTSLQEIRSAYPALLERLKQAIFAAFSINEEAVGRVAIADRATSLAAKITEPSLKAFALRLADKGLSDRAWIESVSNLLTRKSPERWCDNDETEFHHQLRVISNRFKRTELSITTVEGVHVGSCRVILTNNEGYEVGDLFDWDELSDEVKLAVGDDLDRIIDRYGRDGVAAALQALWKHLENVNIDVE